MLHIVYGVDRLEQGFYPDSILFRTAVAISDLLDSASKPLKVERFHLNIPQHDFPFHLQTSSSHEPSDTLILTFPDVGRRQMMSAVTSAMLDLSWNVCPPLSPSLLEVLVDPQDVFGEHFLSSFGHAVISRFIHNETFGPWRQVLSVFDAENGELTAREMEIPPETKGDSEQEPLPRPIMFDPVLGIVLVKVGRHFQVLNYGL